MAVSVYAVANRILQKRHEENCGVTPLQLIKLVYLSHGWHLGLRGESLIEQSVEAWKYGPVIEILYHAVKHFKREPIVPILFDSTSKDEKIPDYSVSIIDQVADIYGDLSGLQLSTLTHQKDTPWDNTKQGKVIKNSLIEEHFKGLLSKNG